MTNEQYFAIFAVMATIISLAANLLETSEKKVTTEIVEPKQLKSGTDLGLYDSDKTIDQFENQLKEEDYVKAFLGASSAAERRNIQNLYLQQHVFKQEHVSSFYEAEKARLDNYRPFSKFRKHLQLRRLRKGKYE